jgi:putative ABC transport system permease protein
MRFFLRIWATTLIVAKRIWSQPGLAGAALVGLVTSIALVISIPLYADAVFNRTLREDITKKDTSGQTVNRPPFAFLFNYSGGVNGNVSWEVIQPLDSFMASSAAPSLGLPVKSVMRYVRTDPAGLFPPDNAVYSDQANLGWVSLGFYSNLADHITLLQGNFPQPSPRDSQDPVEVLVSSSLAVKMGLQVGEQFLAMVPGKTPAGSTRFFQIPVRISGIWEATDAREDFWFIPPSQLSALFFMPQESFINRVSPVVPNEIFSGFWYLIVDGTGVRSDTVGALLGRIQDLISRAGALLPNVGLDVSPVAVLNQYSQSVRQLTILLYAFSIPILGLILAFIVLVAGLTVDRQRNEIAVLRSRGGTAWQIMGITAVESLLLALVGLAVGIPVAMLVARLIGQTRSFMSFFTGSSLQVNLTMTALWAGLAAVAITLLAEVVPAVGASRHTIVSYKQDRARLMRLPWWQRIFLDVLLLIPAGYGAYLLRQQGSLVAQAAGAAGDPFRNPLLFLVPALTILALALLFLRLIPPILAGVAWAAGRTGNVGLTMAARHLSRTPGSYNTPLIILILTLSLSAYTGSLAQTLDRHLYDQTYYKVGADMKFTEVGQRTSAGFSTKADGSGGNWFFFPVTDYLKVPGVRTATRVGIYDAGVESGPSGMESGHFVGIDRLDFPRTAFWRRDFSSANLGELMNNLAAQENGVLVTADFMRSHGVSVGDTIQVLVNTFESNTRLDMKVVGRLDMFPTWYPDQGRLFVGNLDYLFESAGQQFPYQVWLKTDPAIDPAVIGEKNLRVINITAIGWDSAQLQIAKEQQRPERQGVFGMLFIGFAAAAVLTVLGFLLYVLFSFRRRFIELGVLRASGLSITQMASYMIYELAFLLLLGGGAGTALGTWMSYLFIPYLQIGTDAASRIPPFQVIIAWPAIFQIYALFTGLFVITLVVLVLLLWRMKIFQAIKLGETV